MHLSCVRQLYAYTALDSTEKLRIERHGIRIARESVMIIRTLACFMHLSAIPVTENNVVTRRPDDPRIFFREFKEPVRLKVIPKSHRQPESSWVVNLINLAMTVSVRPP